jgi:hypothetical protein
MTIAELIKELSKYDPNLTACVSGYEQGLTEKFTINKVGIILNKNEESYYFGEHEASWGEPDIYVLAIER